MGRPKKVVTPVIEEVETEFVFGSKFTAEYKLPGDKKFTSHNYDVNIHIVYDSVKGTESDTAQDAFIVVINSLNGKNLNELFENDTRHCFVTPKPDNICRHIGGYVLDSIAADDPRKITIELTAADESDYYSGAKMVINCKKES